MNSKREKEGGVWQKHRREGPCVCIFLDKTQLNQTIKNKQTKF